MLISKSRKIFLSTLFTSTFLVSGVAWSQILPDININLNGIYALDAVGLTVTTPFNTVTVNSSSGTFKKSLFGNKIGAAINNTINFNGGSIENDLVGLERGNGGTISNSNIINVKGGVIRGDVLATSDKGGYNGTDRRQLNEINFSNGTIGGNIEGGAGAAQNNINITGGVLNSLGSSAHDKDENYCDKDNGIGNDDRKSNCVSGTVYAGSSSPSTKNQSTNATVTLKDMNNTNSFLSSFIQGSGNEGMIIGGYVTGTSEMKFDGVNGNFQGGFKDFDIVTFTEKSTTNTPTNVKLTGTTYAADTWNVNGILDTNGKTLSVGNASTSNLNLIIGSTGSLVNQFISDANVVALNNGSINGISVATGKNITLTNNLNMTGTYKGDTVNISNGLNGVIKGTTTINSISGTLNNSGLIKDNLILSGNMGINNQSSGKITNATITNNQNTLNINNNGLINGNNTINNADDINKTTNINNLNGGVVTGGLTVKDGILNLNNTQGNINNLNMTSNSATMNINNSYLMNGNNTINSTNSGIINLNNNLGGELTGGLTINSGLNTFNNAGNLHDLITTNNQGTINLSNSGVMSGINQFNNNSDSHIVNITNTANGITGTLGVKDGTLNLTNNSGAIINSTTFNSDSATLNINNNGIMNGTNSINGSNGGTVKLANLATGNLSGILNTNSGISDFSNAGSLHDLTINNQINNLTLANTGTINGTNTINNSTGVGFIVDNKNLGIISGIMNDASGALTINNEVGGKLKDLTMMVSNTGTNFRVENNGSIEGNNTVNVTNGTGRVIVTNNSGANITGTYNNIFGSEITNKDGGTIHDLVFNNNQVNTGITNYGLISNFSLNNTDSTKFMTIFNLGENGGGEVSGNLNVNNGKLYLANTGLVNNINLVADNASQVFIYNTKLASSAIATGVIKGNNTYKGINGSTIEINNLLDGNMTGTLNTQGGTSINNAGVFENFTINNQQTALNIKNTGTINGNNIFNNTAGNSINLTNQSAVTLAGGMEVNGGIMNLNNMAGSTINGYNMVSNGATLNINNEANISGTNTIKNLNNGTSNLTNYTNGVIGGDLIITNGITTLANLGGGKILNLDLKADTGTVNVNNTGSIEGNNIIEGLNNGIINLANMLGGNIKGTLDIKSGLNLFSNAGLISGLTLNNEQDTIDLNNTGLISDTNNFNNSVAGNTINITNASGGNVTGILNSNLGTFNLKNNNGSLIHDLTYTNTDATATIENNGVMNGNNILQNNGSGSLTLSNLAQGLLSGNLTTNSIINPISNAGVINNLNINNTVATQLALNNTGLVTGTGIWTNVGLNNQTGGFINNANLTSNNGALDITNKGTINGNNIFNSTNGGTITLANNAGGVITGNIIVNGGLNEINNNLGSTLGNLTLTANQPSFAINNTGSIVGNNNLNANNEIKINNNGTGTINANFTINSPITTLTQNSSGNFISNLLSNSASNIINLVNSTLSNTTVSGTSGTINLTNTNTNVNTPGSILGNIGTITTAVNVNNNGFTQINNSGTISGTTSDAISPTVADNACPANILELNNSGNISGDISVMNNIFKFNNTATGNVTSNHIDTKDLRLTNAGLFNSDVSYLFSVRDHMEVENTGLIYGRDMAFKLIGKPIDGKDVKGYINNSGTIYSQGTTIGYDGTDADCPTCYGTDSLVINNSGKIVAVDVLTLTNPDLNSHAIDAENATVNNLSGGVIGGSVHVLNYNQKAGANWITFMDKDLTQMSTIIAGDKINIESGSKLTIYTNNDVKAFTNGQKFLLVDAKGMNQNEIDAQIENFTIITDSPFANYQMNAIGHDGFIEFNHVAPTQFATATDITTASHNATILGSQRMYELFVNRDVNQVQGLSSGDSFTTVNKLNFMPLGGYAHQGDKDGHAGYDTNYYGGLGYFEHDFNNNFKGGLGFAYMNNSTDFNDMDGSDGNIDSYRPFAYINYEQGPWKVDLAGGVAKHKVDNNRKYSFNNNLYNSKSKYDADEISGHLNVGYKMKFEDNFIVQPIIGAYAAKLKTDAYDEKGSGPMNMHIKSEDFNSFKSMMGVKLSKEYEFENGGSFTPELHLRWYHELGDTKGGVSAFFLAQEQLFNTSGIESPKDIGDIALRLTTKTGTNLDLFTEAYYQFGNKFYNAGGTVGVQYNF